MARLAARIAGAGLLIASGAVHLDLYLTGYRTIRTIGTAFVLQSVFALVLGAAVLITGRRLFTALGAVLALSTLGGYILSLWVGLFGFKEVRTMSGIVAGAIEIAAFVSLSFAAIVAREGFAHGTVQLVARLARVSRPSRAAAFASLIAMPTAVASLAFGVALASINSNESNSSIAYLTTERVSGHVVVTDDQGFTLYWFGRDRPTASRCYGECSAYWTPIIGRPVATSRLVGRLGTVIRSGGEAQATYDGHPLYKYVGDSAPDEANGNGVFLNGGYWHEMRERN